jgi:membrane-associated phospholipid phosphatase
MYLKSKNGSYSNFDVSDKKQRRSLFVFAIPFLVIVTTVLFLTHQPEKTCYGVLFATLLVVISQLVNFFIKSSLHVSLTLYLAFLAIPINLAFGFSLMFLCIFIGWSRVVLKRHSIKEVIVGAIIGLSIGAIMLYFLTLNG